MEATVALPECPHCGESFKALRDGKIPTHDFPKPCRSVCRGSGRSPRSADDAPLWKDDRQQEERDFVGEARMELLLYGFAVVKEVASLRGESAGTMTCPLCQKALKFSVAKSNGHCHAHCSTNHCINAME